MSNSFKVKTYHSNWIRFKDERNPSETSESFTTHPIPPFKMEKTQPKLSLSLAKSGKVFDIVVLTQS